MTSEDKITNLRAVLIQAKHKLALTRPHLSGEYTGGMEYKMLMDEINKVLQETGADV